MPEMWERSRFSMLCDVIAPVTQPFEVTWTFQASAQNPPPTEMVELAGRYFYLVHSVHDLDLDPVAAGVDLVVSGHSHKPSIEKKRRPSLNPGSAGPRRFNLPVSVAFVTLDKSGIEARIFRARGLKIPRAETSQSAEKPCPRGPDKEQSRESFGSEWLD